MLFLRVIVWCGAEKFSLKKSCFYLYIRRNHEPGRYQTDITGNLLQRFILWIITLSHSFTHMIIQKIAIRVSLLL